MTLEELLAECAKGEPARTVSAAAPIDPEKLQWWVVVLSKKTKPDGSPRVKFAAHFVTQEEAIAERDRRTHTESERIKDLHEQGSGESAFRFFAIERPAGGVL